MSTFFNFIQRWLRKKEDTGKKEEKKKVPYSARFTNFTPKESKGGKSGAQVKIEGTGHYIEWMSGEKEFYIKSSEHPADDIAEVCTSQIMQAAIGNRAVDYDFIHSNRPGESYFVKSEVRKAPLELAVERATDDEFPETVHLSDLVEGYERLGQGWRGKNPTTDRNKDKIYRAITGNKKHKEQLEEDMADILAGSLLTKNDDCHAHNIIFDKDERKDREGNPRLCIFDFGWGLAEICKKENRIVQPFKSISASGARATHGFGILNKPTNHYLDYPKILESQAFINSLQKVIDNGKKVNEAVENSLERIMNNFKDDPKKQFKALKLLAEHVKLKIPKNINNRNKNKEIKDFIVKNVRESLNERIKSMELLRELCIINLLNKKLEEKNILKFIADKNKAKLNEYRYDIFSELIDLANVIKKNYPGKSVKEFMPEFRPPDILEKLIKVARAYAGYGTLSRKEQRALEFCEGIQFQIAPMQQKKDESKKEADYNAQFGQIRVEAAGLSAEPPRDSHKDEGKIETEFALERDRKLSTRQKPPEVGTTRDATSKRVPPKPPGNIKR